MIVVVANAPLAWSESLVSLIRDARMVIAADGGANHLARIGVKPVAVIGDLDSIRPEVRAWLGEALGWLAQRGGLSGEEAYRIGRQVLSENAMALYGLPPC